MGALKILAIAIGFSLLFAWRESLFLHYGLSPRLAARGYGGENPAMVFLVVHCLTYLVMGLLSMKSFSDRYVKALPFAGSAFMLSLPALLFISAFVPSPPAAVLALAGMLLAAVGAAVLFGGWIAFLSTLIPDDVAVVYGLSPLAATFFIRFFTAWDVSLLLLAAPLLSLALLWGAGGAGAEETKQLSPLQDFPIWRLAVFLFCFYAANGFLVSLIPILFPAELTRAGQVTDWIRALFSLGVAFIFRFYPRADLRNFYRGAFPFIAAALFFLTFSPYRTPARFFLEGGLSFLDLYAWLLLIYFASRTGLRRRAVINFGIFIIVFASAAAHYHLHFGGVALLPGQSGLASLALLLLKGAKDLNICSLLYISQNTLKYHLRNIYRKTGSSNRRELKKILD